MTKVKDDPGMSNGLEGPGSGIVIGGARELKLFAQLPRMWSRLVSLLRSAQWRGKHSLSPGQDMAETRP